MTIREIVGLLKNVEKVEIAWNGNLQCVDIYDPIVMDAFGDYLVGGVWACGDGRFEIEVAIKPLKKGA